MADDAREASNIFISYRRQDTGAAVERLYPQLRARFGGGVFTRDQSMVGADFYGLLERRLQTCSVFLAVIGKDWRASEYVRNEIATALKRDDLVVVPVLVGGAAMPSVEELPQDLAELAYRHAFELPDPSDPHWDAAVGRLIDTIERARSSAAALQADAPTEAIALPRASFRQHLERRRQQQIEEMIARARQAFEASEYELALHALDDAVLLYPDHTEALDLWRRARTALDEQRIGAWLAQAREAMAGAGSGRELSIASDLIDQALALQPADAAALQLRQELLAIRRQRERQREEARSRAGEESARRQAEAAAHAQQAAAAADAEPLERRELERRVEKVLALEPVHPGADAVRQRALELIVERQREEAVAPVAQSDAPTGALRQDPAVSFPAARPVEPPARRSTHIPAFGRLTSAFRSAIAAWQSKWKRRAPRTPPQVLLGVSAPRAVKPGDEFAVRFVAYVEAIERVVRKRLRDLGGASPAAVQLATGLTPSGGGRWREGTPVTVRVSGSHVTANPASQSFEWNGRENLLSFLLTVAPDVPGTAIQVCFEAFIEGVPVAFIPVTIGIGAQTDSIESRVRAARPAVSAFASYASADAPQVALSLSGLHRWDPYLDVYMDCLDLTPNAEWQRVLERVIPERDVFLLFWSVNAMKSKWVAWELQTATAKRGVQYIHPMPIDDPSIAPPPEVLKHLHFRDRYLLARQAFLRLGAQRQ